VTDREEAVRAYTTAWSLRDEQAIRTVLARCWTPSTSYVSPLTDEVRGIDGMVSLILDFPVMFPGARLRATTSPQVHPHAAFFAWQLSSSRRIRTLGQDYGRTLDGLDVLEFDDDGRIRRITALFGIQARPTGAAPASGVAERPAVVELPETEAASVSATSGGIMP
jgi:hypothetical protein